MQEDLIKDIVEDCQKRNERKERELKKKKPSPSIGGWSGNSGSGFPLGSGRRCTIWITRTCVDGDSGELGVCDEAEGLDGEPICELDGIEVGGCSYNVHVTCSGGLAMLLEGTGLRLADVVRLADIVGGGPACPASPARQARARPRDGPLASPAPVRRLRGGTKRILAQVEARARS